MLLLVILSLISTVTSTRDDNSLVDHNGVCISPGCVLAAANLIGAINSSVDPCVDFFEFACGRWIRNNPIPDDRSSYGSFSATSELVLKQTRTLLESTQPLHVRALEQTRILYTSCMNTTDLDIRKSTPLLKELKELGYWPLLHADQWQRNEYDITNLLSALRRKGRSVLFSNYVYADSRNTTRHVLHIDQGSLGLGSERYYLNPKKFESQLNAYRKYILDIIGILSSDAKVSISKEEKLKSVNEIVDFETKLAKITVPEEDRRNHTRTYNKKKIVDLHALASIINWTKYFDTILPDDVHSYIATNPDIIVNEVGYLQNLTKLLVDTDERVIVNYVLWRFVSSSVGVLDTRYDDVEQDFLHVLTGRAQKSPRWKDCVSGSTNSLELSTGALYVREYFDKTDKKEALIMIDNLRAAFIELVEQLEWMDEKTKIVAIEKAQVMINMIGYPDFILNDTQLDDHYKELIFTKSDSYATIINRITAWRILINFRKLNKVVDKYEWDTSPAIVNAFYSPNFNSIVFPAGILQPPFFGGNFPKSVNYGAIGAVIGHEITHGFDDGGSQFDKDGNLKMWWDDESFDKFDKNRQCIVDQYDAYKVPNTGLNVNGKLTQGENIADNGGVKESYKAYRKYVQVLGHEEAVLPGLTQFSNDQIFFLSYAHFWCGHQKPESAIRQILTDPHSPLRFRVNGVVSNFVAFADAFQCAKNTPMNPKKRCAVW